MTEEPTTDNNPVHEAVEFYWGERCPDHDPDCPTCKAWGAYDAMKGGDQVSKEDWIILRLLMTTTTASPSQCNDLDVIRSVLHLVKKYGSSTVLDCIAQLHKEKT
jgi:hypothetical protein